jgi:hypothetical protein
MIDEWDIVKQGEETSKDSLEDDQPAQKTRAEVVEELILKISSELKKAHEYRCDVRKAESNASLTLDAQIELTDFMTDAELRAKEAKSEVEMISAERYFFYKASKSGEKVTETALNHYVAKDSNVLEAKKNQYKYEAEFAKYKNLNGILNNAHIYFRGLGKSN